MMAIEGIKVLDLARRYPGAFSAMILGDFGAEVIKIDAPTGRESPVWEGIPEEKFAAFFALDRNKKSITLDLREEEGRSLFYKIVEEADILIEGFRPGVMKRLKADYGTLKEINSRLIYCSLAGYGQDGPYASMPGHDPNYVAIGGILSLIGSPDGPPYFPSNIASDMVTGLYGAIGILIALQARDRTGKGQFVDISYLNSTVSMLHYEAYSYFLTGKVPKRGETLMSGDAPFVQVLECKDGEYFTISCTETYLWENLCKALGREDLIPYQYPSEPEKKREVIQELQKIFLSRSRDEWFEYLKDKNVCVGPVYYLNETFEFSQVRHNQMVIEVEHPKFGKVRQIGIPIKLSDTPGQVRSLGVPIGANNEDVLASLRKQKK